MAIGEAFLSAFLQVLFDRLASNEFMGMLFGKSYDELLEKLKITLLTVTALLGDAEEKQFHSPAVVRWLHAARDGMYDAEDLLDELATEALKCRSKLESWNSLTARVSSTLTPTSSSGKSVESRLRKVVERLEMVAKYKNVLGLRERVGDGSGTERRLETTSLVDEGSVLGRDGDKEAIVAALLAEEGKCDVGVVPIVGMGGIGKTTLAQLAYNDKRVVGRFEIRVWVCVTERFDPVRVTRTILGSIGSRSDADRDEGFDSLQVRLREKLEGKRFLVVFDDVWRKRNGDWDRLWKPMRSGKRGSKVIVTTRNADVAASLGTEPAHRPRRLSNEDCWAVFSRQVSEAGVAPSLKSVGEKIAKRCEGLPMAAKRLGVLLRSRSREDEWNDVSSQRIWDSPSEESDILRTLSPTYLHLPSHLKQCFAFFAVFPPGHEYDKSSLVAMWMSEGFLRQPKGKKKLEEVGDEYFRELVSRSVLEPCVDNPTRFVVHGLLKELADFVAGDFCFRLEESNEEGIFEKARHSSYVRGNRDELTRFEAFDRVKHLRTFLPLDPMIDNIGVSYLADNVPHELLPNLRYLRVLSFSSCRLTKLPDSIGNLKHLRYLNLSRTAIKALPESTNELYNLQTLDLSQCRYLAKLPSKMGNLKFLRNLFISGTRLREMPLQICELRNLQKLSNFVVGENSGSGIKDLGRLSQLRGSLQISGLQNVVGFIDAVEANMKEKRELSRVVFQWNSFDDSCADESYEEEVNYFPQHRDVSTRGYKSKTFPTFRETVNEYDQDSLGSEHRENPRDKRAETLVLEMLQPHTNVKSVTIRGYGGVTFPKWIESPLFSDIKFLKLSNCKKCTDLPAIGQLPSLEDLVLEGMERVNRVGAEFYGDEQPLNSPFSSLKTLKFDNMTSLEEWLSSGTENGREDFPQLHKIEMRNCPKIRTFPIGLGFPSLIELSVWACPNLKELPRSLPSLTMLEIDGCRHMTKLPDLLSIRDLELSNCNAATVQTIPRLDSLSYLRLCQIPNLTRLSDEFFESLTALEELHIADMNGLAALADLRKIRSLERMEISGCTVLEELPRSLSEFSALKELRVWACPSLASFAATTGLPSTLKGLEIRDCKSLQSLPDLKSLSTLEYLIIEGCSSITSLPWDELPCTLKELEIQDCERLQSITKEEATIKESSLEILTIAGCRSITGFHFPGFNLKELTVHDCQSLTRLPDGLRSLTRLEISDCPALVSFHEAGPPGSRAWAALRTITLSNLLGLESLPARMHALASLEALSLESCPNIADFPEGGLPVSLVSLSVLNCENLRPSFQWGLHRLTHLAELAFGGCGGLKEFPDNWLLPNSLSSLQLQRLPSLESLPKGLENLSGLTNLDVWGCDNLRTDKDQLSMLQKFDLWNVL